jgi:outer membrane protein OmpA-like peptidoglycan-associated protein
MRYLSRIGSLGPAVCAFLFMALSTAARAQEPGPSEPSARANPVLHMTVDKSRVDLRAHRLEVVFSRDADNVALKVIGESGVTLAEQDTDVSSAAPGTPVVISWSPSSEEAAAKISIRATDADGHWAEVELLPWSVSIPHRDVLFKTGSWRIEDSERVKLEDSFAKISEVAAHHADLGTVVLWVAGHTDTVGTAADNLRLSRARAQAIAEWLRHRGLRIPISYEGFGESALLVPTADNVDEPSNRRVDYILAFDEPRITANGFRPAWHRMK